MPTGVKLCPLSKLSDAPNTDESMTRQRHYRVEWEAQAAKAFQKIKEQRLKDHVLYIIEREIAADPLIGKPLTGPFKGVRSYRSGILRILYKFYADRLVVVVLAIDHRKNAYRRV